MPQFSPLLHAHQARLDSQPWLEHPSCCGSVHNDFQFDSGALRKQAFKGKICHQNTLVLLTCWPQEPPSCSEMCHLHGVCEQLTSFFHHSQPGELGERNRLCCQGWGRSHSTPAPRALSPHAQEWGFLFPGGVLRAQWHPEGGDNTETWPGHTGKGWEKKKN